MSQSPYEETVDRGPDEYFEGIEEHEQVSPDQACIECGNEMIARCGCCGVPLCSRHVETQAGFCSEFTTHEFSEGQVIGVTDGFNDLEQVEVRFKEAAEISGCLTKSHEPTEKGLFFPMHDLPEGEDEPVRQPRTIQILFSNLVPYLRPTVWTDIIKWIDLSTTIWTWYCRLRFPK